MGTSLNSELNSPNFCTAKRSPTWGITPMQGPRWAPASDFGGAGFLRAGLVGKGLSGEELAGDGLGFGVGAVWARAGCATASASKRAAVRITTSSSVSPRGENMPLSEDLPVASGKLQP